MENDKPKYFTWQDAKFIIAIVVFMFPIMSCYYGLKQDLALTKSELSTIRSNDLAHIEIELTDMKTRNSVADDRQNNMQVQITRLITLSENQ
jgi:hypothetical protein